MGRFKRKRDKPTAAETHDAQADEHDVPSVVSNQANDSQAPNDAETEYFGLLTEEEHEHFREAYSLLKSNFQDTDEYPEEALQDLLDKAKGKELKLACSQSLSRLMEILILKSTTRQKKEIFEAFSTHFPSLVQHRFASHCCEMLFLQTAPIVTEEMGRMTESGSEGEEKTMEHLFLLLLDEIADHIAYLMTDRYASHSLRLLLFILTGRPLEDPKTKSLIQGKSKDHKLGQDGPSNEAIHRSRAVPKSFKDAVGIIVDQTIAGIDEASLNILLGHPSGNPILQILLELSLSMHKRKKDQPEGASNNLLEKLLPGAPRSLEDQESEASAFMNRQIYSQLGSRVVEVILTNCPKDVFEALRKNFLNPRMPVLLRNDIAQYCVIKALNRYNKAELAEALGEILPVMPMLLEKARFNVIKALLERCESQDAAEAVDSVVTALVAACGGEGDGLVRRLSGLNNKEEDKNIPQEYRKNTFAIAAHGSNLVSAMLRMPGSPSKAVQESLLNMPAEALLELASLSMPAATILTTALETPSQIPGFHKTLLSAIMPHLISFVHSKTGYVVVNAIIAVPSKGKDRSIPFFVKEDIANQLTARREDIIMEFTGRDVWRTWRGVEWTKQRANWLRWAKAFDGPQGQIEGPKPWERAKKKPRRA
jgi:nucleolar protein 9